MMRESHSDGSTRRIGICAGGLAALVILAGLTAGCGGGDGAIKRLNPRDAPYLEGVPVPKGFRLDSRGTEQLESGGVRVARHVYVGSADPYAVRDFYQEQMPLLGWNRVSGPDIVRERISLRFEKRHEECTVEITGGLFGRSTIEVIVRPFSRAASPEPPKRLMP